VKINITYDDKENNLENLTVSNEADSFSLSPSGKRAVISTHGELFTIATDRGETHRISNTPGVREMQPHWSTDGKSLAFVSDQNGRQEVWVCDEHGQGLKRISDSDSEKGQLTWSPDAKFLLYTGSDRNLYKYDLAAGKTTILASSKVMGFGGSALTSPQ